jgi:hypothetical protein
MKTALITINTTSQRLPRSRSPINILNRQAKPPITSSPVTYFHPRIGPTHKVGQGRVHRTAPAPLRSLAQSGRPMSVASVPRRQHSESLLPRLVLSGCCLNRLVPFLVCLSERKKRGIGRSFSISETVVRCVSFSESLGLTFPLERLIVTTTTAIVSRRHERDLYNLLLAHATLRSCSTRSFAKRVVLVSVWRSFERRLGRTANTHVGEQDERHIWLAGSPCIFGNVCVHTRPHFLDLNRMSIHRRTALPTKKIDNRSM